MKNILIRTALLTFFAIIALGLQAREDARLLRYPDINGEQIVFVYAGNIWTVDAGGGDARQLTSHKGLELFPKISPDGKWIAFSAEYSGSRQVYVMPSQGGTPRQLTWYNDVGPMPQRGGFDNVVLGWTPDSRKVLFRSNRTAYGDRMGKYFLADLEGGLEEPLPIPHGGFGVLSPGGNKLVFAYVDREFRTWKRYKGGRASNLWIYDLQEQHSTEITDFKGTDHIPVWYGDMIYFASDRDEWLNIHAYDTNTKAVRQLTFHDDFDVMWPSGTGGQLVYESGGHIYRLNLETEESERLVVNIRYDYSNTLPYHKNVKDNIHSVAISPSGNRVLFDARGDIFSLPAGEGTTRNLTRSPGVRAVYPQWSPDGKWIAYYDDSKGEYEVFLLENIDGAEPRQITSNSRGWKYQPKWSPCSRYLVFFDRSMQLQLLDTESGDLILVDRPNAEEIRHYDFSPDSRWITYAKSSRNGLAAIWVYNIGDNEAFQLTGDDYSDSNPVFSKCGEYLYFTSERDFNLSFSAFEFNYLYNTKIYALHLTNESPRLFEPEETEEEAGRQEQADDNSSEVYVNIDPEGADHRTVAFPVQAGSYRSLQATDNGVVYISNSSLNKFILDSQSEETIMEGISMAIVSADGSKFLYQFQGDFGVESLTPGRNPSEGLLDLSDMNMRIDPVLEWEQIFRDGWRIYRDFFYVENLHEVDWEGFYERYSALLPYLNHRFDLDYMFGEMIAETNTGHAYVDYGDFERVDRLETGLLGAELEADHQSGRYVISRIYEGENWNENLRSPLREQGIDIEEGEYLISIEGADITTADNPYMYLEGRAGKTTRIMVNSSPGPDGARTYTIRPISGENELRHLDWVNTRRRMVEEMSDGRIGYIYVPNTSFEGNRELFRGMYAYHHKDALIIDERFNGGGFIPDRMVEILGRETHAKWYSAGLEYPMRTPGVAHDGPKAMLINQFSSSGGDAFPYFFRQKELGTIIGTRTWGGLVGMTTNAGLKDGGYIGVPRFGIYNEEGEWIIEGIGIYPDIEVVDEPHRIARGEDPSLEKAVEVLMRELEENPPREWPVPDPPDRSGWIEAEIE